MFRIAVCVLVLLTTAARANEALRPVRVQTVSFMPGTGGGDLSGHSSGSGPGQPGISRWRSGHRAVGGYRRPGGGGSGVGAPRSRRLAPER